MGHLLVCIVAALALCCTTVAVPLTHPPILRSSLLFPCGCDAGDQVLSGCDDCNSGVQHLQLGSVKMYGHEYQSYKVHSNGYVTFPAEGPTAAHYSFTPSDLGSLSGAPMIAAYWADADLQAGNGGVFYRESAAEFELDRASSLIQARFGGTYRPSSVIVLTWNETGYYYMHQDKLNTFQMVLATGGSPVQTYLILFYQKIQWTTGDLSGGSGGLGGTKAQVGYASGSGNSQNLPGTGTNAVLDLPYQSNIHRHGTFVLRIDQESQCTSTPAAQALPPIRKEYVLF